MVRDVIDAIVRVRFKILEVGEKNIDTVIPSYTNGVPAQPATFAPYLLAFNDSFERYVQSLDPAYNRLNRPPSQTLLRELSLIFIYWPNFLSSNV
jgi:argininosuccinate lyase